MHKYTVVVGNLGTVVDTDSVREARKAFDYYASQSQFGLGRAADEPVTLFCDGEIAYDYQPDCDPDGDSALCNA